MLLARLRIVAAALLVTAVAATTLVAAGTVLSIRVSGTSMEPTLHTGDRVLVSPFGFEVADSRLKIVVGRFREGGPEVIKRVIGVPGDKVRISKPTAGPGVVSVQPGAAGPWLRVENPAWATSWKKVFGSCCTAAGKLGAVTAEQTVPAGKLFVLGDNLRESDDSRAHGWLNATTAHGIAEWRVFPFSDVGRVAGAVRLIPSS